MANHQIDITENGTVTLATAGKYCDRNVDVNVNVPEQPTQFTNLVDSADAVIKYGYRPTSSGFVATEYAVAIAIKASAGEEAKVRLRGCMYAPFISPANENLYCSDAVTADGYTAYSTETKTTSLDEYGDLVITVANPLRDYIIFGMGDPYADISVVEEALPIEIITLNEPIGNGGYVG